jgi:type II secretion system protein J
VGFTLLEMLIATALVALVAAALYSSLFVAFKAKSTAADTVENLHRGQRAIELVQADVQSAVVPGGTLAGDFIGNAGTKTGQASPDTDILSFYSAAMDIAPDTGIGDLKRIEYVYELSGKDELTLVRLVTTNLLPVGGVTPTPKREVIARGLCNFTVQYFDGLTWYDTWDSTTTDPDSTQAKALPKAIEVILEFKSDSNHPGQTVDQTLLICCGKDQAAIAAAQAAAQTGGGS